MRHLLLIPIIYFGLIVLVSIGLGDGAGFAVWTAILGLTIIWYVKLQRKAKIEEKK
jgi:hypothetical protein